MRDDLLRLGQDIRPAPSARPGGDCATADGHPAPARAPRSVGSTAAATCPAAPPRDRNAVPRQGRRSNGDGAVRWPGPHDPVVSHIDGRTRNYWTLSIRSGQSRCAATRSSPLEADRGPPRPHRRLAYDRHPHGGGQAQGRGPRHPAGLLGRARFRHAAATSRTPPSPPSRPARPNTPMSPARPRSAAPSAAKFRPRPRPRVCTLNEIIVGTGGKQVIFDALLATVDDGDEVIIPAPCWVLLSRHRQARRRRCGVLACHADPRLQAPTRPSSRPRSRPRTKWLLLNNPCNPTGAVYAVARTARPGRRAAAAPRSCGC